MTKRTAMLMAAGVVAALLGGSVALSFGLSGGGTATAETPKGLRPRVRAGRTGAGGGSEARECEAHGSEEQDPEDHEDDSGDD